MIEEQQLPEREADDRDGAKLQLVNEIDVVPSPIIDVADLLEALGIGKARMSGQIDCKVLGKLLVERHPLRLTAR